MEQIFIPYGEAFTIENNPDIGGLVLTIPKKLLQKGGTEGTRLLFLTDGHSIRTRDIENIAEKYGKVTIERLDKNSFKAIYEDPKDATDALKNLDGIKIDGEPLKVYRYDIPENQNSSLLFTLVTMSGHTIGTRDIEDIAEKYGKCVAAASRAASLSCDHRSFR